MKDLENLMDRGAWQAAVHVVATNGTHTRTRTHTQTHTHTHEKITKGTNVSVAESQ